MLKFFCHYGHNFVTFYNDKFCLHNALNLLYAVDFCKVNALADEIAER